jgi:hypothetical protein
VVVRDIMDAPRVLRPTASFGSLRRCRRSCSRSMADVEGRKPIQLQCLEY